MFKEIKKPQRVGCITISASSDGVALYRGDIPYILGMEDLKVYEDEVRSESFILARNSFEFHIVKLEGEKAQSLLTLKQRSGLMSIEVEIEIDEGRYLTFDTGDLSVKARSPMASTTRSSKLLRERGIEMFAHTSAILVQGNIRFA